MFVIKGMDRINMAVHTIPDNIERIMQKRHSKWCDSASLHPWTIGSEVGATLRVRMKRNGSEDFAVSWGLTRGETFDNKPVVRLYLGDIVDLLGFAADSSEESGREEARKGLFDVNKESVMCVDHMDLVSKVIQEIQDAVVAHKMMEGS